MLLALEAQSLNHWITREFPPYTWKILWLLWEDRHSVHFQYTEDTSAGSFHYIFFLVTKSLCCCCQWPCGLMDKASDFGSEDYRFESCHGRKDGLLFEGFRGGRSHRKCRFDPCFRKIPWRRKWQPTLVFLPGESHGQGNLVGYTVHGVTKSWK